MKELSIEEKAKRYDEALEKAKNYHSPETVCNVRIAMENLFPELKESEDERIRKYLIRVTEGQHSSNFPTIEGFSREQILAWLEKQDSYYTFEIEKGHWYKCVCDYMPNGSDLIFKHDRLYYCRSDWRLIGEIDERNVKDIGVNGYKSFFRPATNQEIKYWLEKQDEQKDILEDAIIDSNEDGLIAETIRYKNEKKPTDKVEPKFKVGDWVVYDHRPYQVVELPKEGYINLGLRRNGKIEYVPSTYCRPWTIQDAKDGDVLAAHECYVIFKEIDGLNIKCYCTYHYLGFNPSFYVDTLQNKDAFHPAAKEQCDTLMKAMTDAGYTFDFEKKELKKIEQNHAERSADDLPEFESYLCLMFQKFRTKGVCTNGEIVDFVKEHSQKLKDTLCHAWSKEDELYIRELESLVKQVWAKAEHENDKETIHKMSNLSFFLKTLKPQLKKEWSEEDEKNINELIRLMEQLRSKYVSESHCYPSWGKLVDWLKSLRPQSHWKPSNEQMEALWNIYQGGKEQAELATLYNDLKKL